MTMNRKMARKQAGEETVVFCSASIPFTFHNDDTEFIILIIQNVSKYVTDYRCLYPLS